MLIKRDVALQRRRKGRYISCPVVGCEVGINVAEGTSAGKASFEVCMYVCTVCCTFIPAVLHAMFMVAPYLLVTSLHI